MSQYFLVDANNTVVNSCEWDGVTDWEPPQGLRAVPAEGLVWHDGWKWDGTKAYDPNSSPSDADIEKARDAYSTISPAILGINKL